jgi:hypothetical protein
MSFGSGPRWVKGSLRIGTQEPPTDIEISEKVFMNSLEDWVGGVRKPSSGHI